MMKDKTSYTLWVSKEFRTEVLIRKNDGRDIKDLRKDFPLWKITKLETLPTWYALAVLIGDVLTHETNSVNVSILWAKIPRKYYDEREES